jgi:molecular chaperone GrpE
VTERRDDAEKRQGPVIRDKRRIDPETGKVRESAKSAPAAPDGEALAEENDTEDAAKLTEELAERTADLQRLQAEYANYRKRIERDRVAMREQALANVLNELLPVLDDIGRAREHDELTGGFKQVAEALENAVGKLGLTAFGEPGEAFDPTIHEALLHSYADDVTEPVAAQILQPGYRIGERVLRPARVAVAEPSGDTELSEEPESPEEAEPSEEAELSEESGISEESGAEAEPEPENRPADEE